MSGPWKCGSLFPDDPDQESWHPCARLENLAEGKGFAALLDGQPIAIFLDQGRIEAIDARCPHAAGPLHRGWLDGAVVVCPLHRWKFDIRTGHCLTSPDHAIRHYRTRVDQSGVVWVESAASVE